MKKVLVYSHDTFGLGNLRRMLEVARHLVAHASDVSVLLITGSPLLHAFRIPPGIDTLKLPCLQRNVQGQYGARSLNISLHDTVRLRANLIRSAMADFAPDLVLVDKKPFGVEDELAGALQALGENGRRPELVLLLRDILDSPDVTARVWHKNGYFEAITNYYSQVLVVGSPEVFDLRREYQFPPFAAAKVRYCGYIARQPGRHSRTQARQALGVASAQPLVLVTPGGGEDGHALVDAALRGLAGLPPAQRPRMHIVCGPEMASAQRERLFAMARALPGVSTQEFSDDMMSLHAAADVVVAMGGYNTVCELLSCGRRAVLVPRTRPGQEQCIRAQRMAALGLLAMLHPDELSPAALMQAVQRELHAAASGQQRARLQAMQGLENTTAALLESLGQRGCAPLRASAGTRAPPRIPTHIPARSQAAAGLWA